MIKDSSIYLLAYLIPSAFGFLTFSAYTHLIDPAQYGIYSTCVSAGFFASNVLFGWVRQSMARNEAETDDAPDLRFWLRCFGYSFGVLLAVTVAAMLLVPRLQPIIWPVAILCVSQALFDLTQEAWRAKRQSRQFAVLGITRSVLTMSLGLVVASTIANGTYLVLSLAAGFAVAALISLFQQRHALSQTSRSPDSRAIFLYGIGIATSSLLFSSISVTARLVVIAVLGAEASGAYNAAFDFAGQIGTLASLSVLSSIGPRLIKTYETEGAEKAVAAFARGLELLAFAMLPVMAGIALIAGPLARVATGNAFHEPLALLLPYAVVAVSLAALNHSYLQLAFQIRRKPALQILTGATQAVAAPAFAYVGASTGSLIGAALGVITADLLGVAITYLLARSVFPVPIPMVPIAKVVAATAFMSAAVWAVVAVTNNDYLALAIAVPAGAAAYALACYALNVLKIRESISAPTFIARRLAPQTGQRWRATSLSFCICSYRRASVIETMESIQRIEGIDTIDAEIIVSDDDPDISRRDLIEAFAKQSSIPVTYVASASANVANARNSCLRAARGQWIVFVDDDQLVDPTWLDHMLQAQQDYAADVIRSQVVAIYPPNTPEWALASNPYSRDYGPTGTELPSATTGGVMMSRRLIDELGLRFDPAFGATGGEDIDFFRRARQHGITIIACREAKVIEVVPEERMTTRYFRRRYRAIGEVEGLDLRKLRHEKGLVTPILKAVAFVAMAPGYFALAILTPSQSHAQARRLAWAQGLFGGLVFGERRDVAERPRWN
jgi:succinoglycan biosynthesis protein ExoM